MKTKRNEITLAHSPDSDDAFMFYGLAKDKVNTYGYDFKHTLKDIETLNKDASNRKYDITALSFHAYARLHKKYDIMTCGASIGENYGPMLISKKPMKRKDLAGKTIAIPGKMTTAYLLLRLYAGDVNVKKVHFDKIPDAVKSGKADVGLIIHEGQLTYKQMGLHKIVDLGTWWNKDTGLPCPLGCNGVKRSYSKEKKKTLQKVVKSSIVHGLKNRKEALAYAIAFGRGLNKPLSDKFVGMYVNDYTVNIGPKGRKAVKLLLKRAYDEGIISEKVTPTFV